MGITLVPAAGNGFVLLVAELDTAFLRKGKHVLGSFAGFRLRLLLGGQVSNFIAYLLRSGLYVSADSTLRTFSFRRHSDAGYLRCGWIHNLRRGFPFYRVSRKVKTVELRVYIRGERIDLFADGEGAQERFFGNHTSLNLNTETIRISEVYLRGTNVISVSIPLKLRERKLITDPTILSIVLGIVCGLLCQHLPEGLRTLIVDDLGSRVMDIVLSIIAGIMGPVIFVSLATSIMAFNSIEEFTDLGLKVFKRFVVTALFLMAIALVVSAVFFVGFGDAGEWHAGLGVVYPGPGLGYSGVVTG